MERIFYRDHSGEVKANGRVRQYDDGLNGKNFEVNVRYALQGALLRKTTVTANDGRGYDIKRKDGTRIEVKSGCGVLAYQVFSNDDYTSTTELPKIDIGALLPRCDYVIYAPNVEELESVYQARVFTRDQFLEMLTHARLFRYKLNSAATYYDVTIQTFKTSKVKMGIMAQWFASVPTFGEWLNG